MTVSKGIAQRCVLLAAGFVSNRTLGGAELEHGFGLILLATLLGAFCGLIFGLVCSNLIRYASFLAGRHVNGNVWIISSVVLGALLFAWLTATGGGEPEDITPPGGIVQN